MGKRKLELEPEELVHKLKKNKFENINGIADLIIELKVLVNKDDSASSSSDTNDAKQFKRLVGSDLRKVLACVNALTEVCIQFINDGDLSVNKNKPDDLKNASEKYKDWAIARFSDILYRSFIPLLHHQKESLCKHVLKSLMRIIKQMALVQCAFPIKIYKNVLNKLLVDESMRRDIITSLKADLKHEDLAYQTFIAVNSITHRGIAQFSEAFKHNLITLIMLVHVPCTSKSLSNVLLWCSHRPEKSKKNKDENEKENNKNDDKNKKKNENSTSQKKKKKKANEKLYDHRKSRYTDVIDQTLNNGEADEAEEEGEDNCEEDEEDNLEELMNTNLDDLFGDETLNEDIDSEEEQRKADDEEFKKGRKVKKPRKDRLKDLEEDAANNVEANDDVVDINDEFKEAVARGPKLKPVSDKQRLLPKGLFGEGNSKNNSHEEEGEDNEEEESNTKPQHKGPVFLNCYKQSCVLLTKIWGAVMRVALTEDLYKKCLVFIPEHVMDHLKDPLRLTDFFMESYNCGGVISLMAMRGVFMLITKHNLYYPDFYPKVYTLLEPTVCNEKYKPRFFLLLNVFLSSTHLPEYIAATFAKKLARLLHFAPQHSTLLILKCINNLMARFPSLSMLYDSDGTVTADPFDIMATDLQKARATDSSLWEVASVSKCAPEKVFKGTLFIKRVMTPEETEIKGEHLELHYEDLDPTTVESASNINKAAANFKLQERFISPSSTFGSFLNL